MSEPTGTGAHGCVLPHAPLHSCTQRSKVNRKMQPVMETRGSKFVKFQEARIQELAEEVGPRGCTRPAPRYPGPWMLPL